jgi:hypothetical protein
MAAVVLKMVVAKEWLKQGLGNDVDYLDEQ